MDGKIMEFITVQLYDGTIVQFSKGQWDLISWCINHSRQLQRIKDSKALEVGGSSFEVHLKPTNGLHEIPEIEERGIKLHWNV